MRGNPQKTQRYFTPEHAKGALFGKAAYFAVDPSYPLGEAWAIHREVPVALLHSRLRIPSCFTGTCSEKPCLFCINHAEGCCGCETVPTRHFRRTRFGAFVINSFFQPILDYWLVLTPTFLVMVRSSQGGYGWG